MKIKKFIVLGSILLWCSVMVGFTIFRPLNDENIRRVRILSDEEIYDIEHKKEIKEWLKEHPEDTVTPIPSIKKVEEEVRIEQEQKKQDILVVSCTVYNPTKSQCWGNPLITADGSKISISSLEKGEIRWIAVSRDLLRVHGFKLGDKVKLTCEKEPRIDGVWEIHDTMAERWRKKIDLLQPLKNGLMGTWSEVKIEKA